jgi:hypothetical protein
VGLFQRGRRRGSNAIEFAILLPVYLSLVSAGVDLGWLLFHRASLDFAVNRGCRDGSMVDYGALSTKHLAADRARVKMRDYMLQSGATCGESATCVHDGTNVVIKAAMVDDGNPSTADLSVQCEMGIRVRPVFGLMPYTGYSRSHPMYVGTTSILRAEFQ